MYHKYSLSEKHYKEFAVACWENIITAAQLLKPPNLLLLPTHGREQYSSAGTDLVLNSTGPIFLVGFHTILIAALKQ